MELTTQCPQCQEVFDVSLEALQRRKGYIRCVNCSHIFDGFDAVLPGESTDTASPSMSPPTPESDASTPTEPFRVADEPVYASESKTDSEPHEFHITTYPVRYRSNKQDPFVSDTIIAKEKSGRAEPTISIADSDTAAFEPAATQTPVTEAEEEAYVDHGARAINVVWFVLVLGAALILLAQAIFVYRVQLAEAAPGLRPYLEQACEKMHCTVAWSRRPDHIKITQSSLQSDRSEENDDEKEEAQPVGELMTEPFLLTLTLRNSYSKPQEWPTLVLDLTDATGSRVARKHLPAQTYLPARVADKPFPAQSEREIALPLTLQGLNVNGYQLSTFFP